MRGASQITQCTHHYTYRTPIRRIGVLRGVKVRIVYIRNGPGFSNVVREELVLLVFV